MEPFNTCFNSKKFKGLANPCANSDTGWETLDVHNIDKDNKIARIAIYDDLTEISKTFDLDARQCVFLAKALLYRAKEVIPNSVPFMAVTNEHMLHDDGTPFEYLTKTKL